MPGRPATICQPSQTRTVAASVRGPKCDQKEHCGDREQLQGQDDSHRRARGPDIAPPHRQPQPDDHPGQDFQPPGCAPSARRG
jgi:hypothetical protein